MNLHTRSLMLPILLALLLLAACQPAATALPQPTPLASPVNQSTPWPTAGWMSASPESQGMDSARLDEMLTAAKGLGLHSLLIVRHGLIVSETYYPPFTAETRHDMYSVTKSFISTLVGIAVDQELLSVDDLALGFFPAQTFANLDPRKQAMTVDNLLTMSSGLNWVEGDPAYSAMYRSPDWSQYVLDLPMATDPGSRFVYCSGCSHVLSAILQAASGENTRDFAQENLFDPLGIQVEWETDSQGIPIGGWGLQVTPRDMAKLGYLYLHQGMWEGRQIVSSEWVQSATQKQIETDGGGYGYQWWLNPDLGGYSAQGRYGQTIFVQPELDLVLVTTAHAVSHDQIFALIEEYILPAAQ